MKELEKHQIIELDDDKEYVIVEKYSENDIDYVMLLEIQDEEVTENIMYAKVIQNGTGLEIKKLSLEEEKEFAEIFIPMFEQDYT